jgi:uncharacterized membrane protein
MSRVRTLRGLPLAGGGVWGKVRDKGFKDEDLRSIGESLPPGSSAIIAVAEDHGFMYSRSFFDLDGHGWQVMWMDPAAAG